MKDVIIKVLKVASNYETFTLESFSSKLKGDIVK